MLSFEKLLPQEKMVVESLVFCFVKDGSVVVVRIGPIKKLMGPLKNDLKEMKPDTIKSDADEVQFFLAKTMDDTWLSSGDPDVISMKKKADIIPERVEVLLKEEIGPARKIDDVFQGAPMKKTIHVLVVVPETSAIDFQLLHLQELLCHTLMDDPTSTSAPNQRFQASLITTYQCDMGTYQDDKKRMLRCMLLNTALPSKLVIASHLFRRKNKFMSRYLMGFSNVDDVTNGLMLFKPLKHAFDHFQISFIYDQPTNKFRLKVFDPSLREQRLFEMLNENQRRLLLGGRPLKADCVAPGTKFDIQTTFGDIEGRPLCFMSVERPYKRCLNLQARLARMKAIEEKWIQREEGQFEDFWSERMSLAEKMQFFSARES